MTDEELLAELERRVARDNGDRIPLDEVMRRCGITHEELDAMPDEDDA